jgi:hypothetical protein
MVSEKIGDGAKAREVATVDPTEPQIGLIQQEKSTDASWQQSA